MDSKDSCFYKHKKRSCGLTKRIDNLPVHAEPPQWDEVPHWGLRESWCRPGAIGGTNARSMCLKIEERPLPLPSEWAIHHGAWETSERAGKELASSTSGCRKTHQFDKAQTLAMMRVSGPTSNRATSYSDNHIARESELFLKKKVPYPSRTCQSNWPPWRAYQSAYVFGYLRMTEFFSVLLEDSVCLQGKSAVPVVPSLGPAGHMAL